MAAESVADRGGLLPASTNAYYRGSPWSAWFLLLVGVATVGPGLIHFLLPDGGAGSIAGLQMGAQSTTIIAVFAWFGAMQIPHGITEIIIAVRYRTLTPLFLALVILERALMAWDGWFGKGAGSHHPPEHYGSAVVVVLAAVFLALALGDRSHASNP